VVDGTFPFALHTHWDHESDWGMRRRDSIVDCGSPLPLWIAASQKRQRDWRSPKPSGLRLLRFNGKAPAIGAISFPPIDEFILLVTLVSGGMPRAKYWPNILSGWSNFGSSLPQATYPKPCMILIKVSGRPGHIWENRMDVLQQLGKLAALINSIRCQGIHRRKEGVAL